MTCANRERPRVKPGPLDERGGAGNRPYSIIFHWCSRAPFSWRSLIGSLFGKLDRTTSPLAAVAADPGTGSRRPASQGTLRQGRYSSRMPATEFEDFANECIGIARRARGTRDGDAMWRMARAWLVIAQVMAELKGEAEAATRRAI